MRITCYRDLRVWRQGIEIVDFVYGLTSCFPKTERYGLAQQLQRAAVSIPSNIAEGFARQYANEYRQFCFIALGSCAEVVTQATIAHRRDYINDAQFEALVDACDRESRMLTALTKRLRT